MKVSLEKEGVNVVKLGLEIEASKAQKAYEVACKQLAQRVKIPGFRPGKAPRGMVEQTVGVDYIKREALEQLVPQVLEKVIQDEKLDVITEPQIESYNFELGQPLTLNATFEVRPEVTLGDYKGLKVRVPEAKLDDASMDRALQSIAEAKSSLKTVEGRAIKAGDTVLLDFECYVEDKLVEGGKAEGLLLEVKDGNFLEGFCEQLVDKQAPSSTEIKAKFPDEYRINDLAGKDALFKVDIREIRERMIPDINDELAKSIGQESLDALKDALSKRLEEEVKQENDARVQRLVVDAVVDNGKVEIPDTMVDREVNLLLAYMKRMVEQDGRSWEEFVRAPEYTDIYKDKREEARRRVLTSLVLGAVVRAENMTITNEEATPYLAELVARYNIPLEQIPHNPELQRAVEQLRRQAMEEALTRKVVDFLTGQSNVEWYEAAEDEKTEEAKPEKEKATKGKKKAAEPV